MSLIRCPECAKLVSTNFPMHACTGDEPVFAGASANGGDVYHVARMFGNPIKRPYAGCDRERRLAGLHPADETPAELRCQRSGCRQRWPK
jgi:hypothetical protein